MAATGKNGRGTTLTRSGFSYKIRDLKGPGPKIETFDASNFDTTGGKDYIADDCYDPGELTLEVENTGTFPTMDGSAASTVIAYRGGGSRTVSTIITGFEPSVPQAGIQTATMTLKCTGAIS